MATTAFIIEVLIIGLFAAAWLFLLCLRVSLFDFDSFVNLALRAQGWSTSLTLAAAAILYQLGWIVNSVADKLMYKYNKRGVRENAVPGVSYEYVRAVVHQKGSAEILRDIGVNLTFERLARAGVVNFSLTAVILFSFGGRAAVAGLFLLPLAAGCVPLSRMMSLRYYARMKSAYEVISEERAAP